MHSVDEKLYLVTNSNAPNQKLIVVNAKKPQEKYWKDFIPEEKYVLSPTAGGGYFFARYIADVITKVIQYDMDGVNMGEIELPGLGTAYGWSGKKDQEVLYFSFTNYHSPSQIFSYNPKTKMSIKYWEPKIDFDSNDYKSEQIFYKSEDGTKIPMIITYKKGIKFNGQNPTILYGYGGFNISIRPSFSIANAVWLEQGGIYAVPNIRGGGEYGKEWHKAGTQQKKQNVFNLSLIHI